MGGHFGLDESLRLCILIFCQLPTNCFHNFFVWMRFYVCLFLFFFLAVMGHCFFGFFVVCFFLLFLSEMGKSMFCTTFLSRNTNVLDFNFNIVYHSLIRAVLSLALYIMSVQLTLAAWKDPLTAGKSGTYIYIYCFDIIFVCQ